MSAIEPENTIHPIDLDALSNRLIRKTPNAAEITIPTLMVKESLTRAGFTIFDDIVQVTYIIVNQE